VGRPAHVTPSQKDSMSENPSLPSEDDASSPFNDVERAIVDGAEGRLENNEVLSKIVTSSLFFLTAQEPTEESTNVEPLILQGPDQKPVLAVFTHPARVAQQFVDSAPIAVSITGGEAFKQAAGLGVAINPGHPIGLVLDAANVETIRGLLAQ
jgi:hypothetical protein